PHGSENRVCNRRSSAGHAGLSNAACLLIAVHNVCFYFRTFIHAHQRKCMEIRLLQPPILEGELLKKRGRCAEDCAAFQLSGDDAWVYVMSAIYRAHDSMHPDFPVLDRDFRHLRVVALKREVHRDSPAAAFRQWLTPSSFL